MRRIQCRLYTLRPLHSASYSTIQHTLHRLDITDPSIIASKPESTFLSENAATDAALLLKSLKPKQELIEERSRVLQNLLSTIRPNFGKAFDVKDVSLWRYATDLQNAPLEFAIVERNRGFREQPGPNFNSALNLQEAYSHSEVVKLLSHAGFSGITQSYSADRRARLDSLSAEAFKDMSGSSSTTLPWPEYDREKMKELRYPPTLEVTYPVNFHLTLAGSPILSTIRLLDGYCCFSQEISQFITLLFSWTHSLGMYELTPTCVSLMAIQFLQSNVFISNLQSVLLSITGETASNSLQPYTWIPVEYTDPLHKEPRWIVEPYKVNTTFVRGWKMPMPSSVQLLFDFFSYWKDKSRLAPASIVSVREGGLIMRKSAMLQPPNTLTPETQLKNNRRTIISEQYHPPRWLMHPLVVQDPFIFTHNHAQFVSRTTVDFFVSSCLRAWEHLSRGQPFLNVFGPSLETESLPMYSLALDKNTIAVKNPAKERLPQVSSIFNDQLVTLIQASRLEPNVLKRREQTVQRFEDFVRQKYGPKFSVEVFGSTCLGLDSKDSDLDLVILDKEMPNGFPPGTRRSQLPPVYKTGMLARLLRHSGFCDITFIPKATVPIVKFTDPVTKVHCDVNVNERLGTTNTAMISHYLSLSPVLRSLLIVIKHWAKHHKFYTGGASGGAFSSYALNLMIIGVLQMRGGLPNLQADALKSEPPEDEIYWAKGPEKLGKATSIPCNISWSRVSPKNLQELTTEEALLDWFDYWGNRHPYATHALSVRHGGLIPRDEILENTKPIDQRAMDAAVYVLDPFLPTKNVTLNISKQDIASRFQEECRRAAVMMRWGCSLEDLIGK